jgi:mannosyltransferase OCH1-like enzyme
MNNNKNKIKNIILILILIFITYVYIRHGSIINFIDSLYYTYFHVNKLNNYTITIPHYIPKRTTVPLLNKTMLIKTSLYDKSDYHHVVYFINSSTVSFIIRRLDNDTINYHLYLYIYNNNDNTYERIFIHKKNTNNRNYYTTTYTITSSSLQLLKTPLNYEQKIPKKIIQTSKTSTCTLAQYNALQTFLELNPEYEYYHYTNNDSIRYLKKYYNTDVIDAYNKVIPGAYKADLFRACIINNEGGCYFDNKQINREPLRTFICKNDTHVLCVDDINDNVAGIYNAIYISIQNTDLTTSYVNNIVYNIQNNYYGINTLCPTGPHLLIKVFNNSIYKNTRIRLYHKAVPTDPPKSGIYDKLTNKKIISTCYVGYYNNRKKTDTYAFLWDSRKVY